MIINVGDLVMFFNDNIGLVTEISDDRSRCNILELGIEDCYVMTSIWSSRQRYLDFRKNMM